MQAFTSMTLCAASTLRYVPRSQNSAPTRTANATVASCPFRRGCARKLRCSISQVNATTFETFKWEIQGLWQPYCAINRGIFVLQPGNPGWENHTYSCGTLPADWGITNIGDLVNAPVETALKALDLYIQAVFNSSDPIVGDSAC